MQLRNRPPHQVTVNWVKEVIAFANLENPDDILIPNSLHTVDDGKYRLDVDSQGDWADPDNLSIMDLLYNFIGGSAPDGFGDSQATLRKVLKTLTAHGVTPGVHQLISDKIDRVHVQGILTFSEGYLRHQSIGHFRSHEQWWAVGIASLLHSGLGDRVRQCGWCKCEAYFVDWPRKGQSKLYCCAEHQNKANQQRYRDNKKRKRMLQKANQSMGN